RRTGTPRAARPPSHLQRSPPRGRLQGVPRPLSPGPPAPGPRSALPRRRPGRRPAACGRQDCPFRPPRRFTPGVLLGRLIELTHRGVRHTCGSWSTLLVKPDTVLRWHRELVRRKWASFTGRPRRGRPSITEECQELIRQLARGERSLGLSPPQGRAP